MAELPHGAPTTPRPETGTAAHGDQGLRVYTLGGFRIERGDESIPADQWSRRSALRLLKCLLSRRTRRMPRDEAYELFWPDSAPEAATNNLRGTLFVIRRVLEPGVDARDSIIFSDHDTIGIRADADLWIDADAFEQLLAQAHRSEAPADLLEAADRLYTGDYLPDDLYDDWTGQRREPLRNLWTELQFDLSRAREQHGDAGGAIRALQRLLESDRCNERAARELMLVSARHGRRTDALRAYERLVEALREELDADPSPETVAVQQQVASGSAGAGPASPRRDGPTRPDRGEPRAPTGTGGSVNGVTTGRLAGRDGLAPAPPAPFERPRDWAGFEPSYPFPMPGLLVGRQDDLLAIQHTIERGRRGGQTITIGAPAGTGKSALAGMLVAQARAQGVLCLAGGSFDDDRPTLYGPIRDALADFLLAQPPEQLQEELGEQLADLAPIVPELRYHLPDLRDRADGPLDPRRLLAAIHGLLRELAVPQPILICLDDVHAADDATLELFHYLARQTRRLRVTLVATYRTEEVPVNRGLSRLLHGLAREGVSQEIVLRPLQRQETQTLMTSLLGGPVGEPLADALYEVTEGNPLFIEQLTLALREERRIDRRDGVWAQATLDDLPIPPLVQGVIERRLDRLPPGGRETLMTASVLGQTFDLPSLIAALDADDDTAAIAVLDQAISAQLVRETANGYRFGHAMIRETLYRSMSGPRRALLHARAGQAIEALAGDRAPERAGELAHHFGRAASVAQTAEQAVRYSVLAGRRAASLSAYREALDHYGAASRLVGSVGQSGGGLGGSGPGADSLGHGQSQDAVRLQILEGQARAERELGLWTQCVATCRSLIDQSPNLVLRAEARSMISRALRSLGDTGPAMHEAEIGLSELDGASDDPEVTRVRVRLMYDRAFLLGLQGRFREEYTLGKQALELGETLGRFDGIGLPLNAMLIGAMSLNQVDLAVQTYERAVEAAREARAEVLEAVFNENVGMALYRAGRFDEAGVRLRRALELYGPTTGQVRAVNAIQMLARVTAAQGQVEDARRQVEQALTFATDSHDRWAAECYELLGGIALLRANWSAAVLSYERSLAVYEQTGDPTDTADCLVGLGLVSDRQGAWEHAEGLYRRAIAVADRADPCPEQIGPRRQLGLLLARRGDPDAARTYLGEALRLAESMLPTIEYAPTLLAVAESGALADGRLDTDTIERAVGASSSAAVQAEAHALAAGAQSVTGAIDSALAHLEAASKLTMRLGAPRLLGLVQLASGQVAIAREQIGEAADAFEAAQRLFEDIQAPYELAVTMREHGRLLADRGDPARGRPLLEAARQRFSRLGAGPDAAACQLGAR